IPCPVGFLRVENGVAQRNDTTYSAAVHGQPCQRRARLGCARLGGSYISRGVWICSAGRAARRLRGAAAAQRFHVSGSLAGGGPARGLRGGPPLALPSPRGRLPPPPP